MSDAPAPGKSFRLRGRWVVVILAASLALNIFFAAMFLGHKFRGHHHCGKGGGFREFVHRNPDVKDIARKLRREKREAFRERRQAIRAARAAYIEALRAEPFDEARFEAAQAAFVDARRAMRSLRHDGVRKMVGAMTPEQRQRFATHLAKRAECREKRHKDRMKREDQAAPQTR